MDSVPLPDPPLVGPPAVDDPVLEAMREVWRLATELQQKSAELKALIEQGRDQ